ncbi:MAG: hypothetical protein DSY60_04295, partial [Persephonella sp.]
MKNLKIKNFGRIKKGNINFGDLTVFVGPQATGKTLVLELIKLIKDDFAIASTLVEKGYEWNNIEEFSNIYFGEGTDILWKDNTKIYINRKLFVSFSILKKIDLEKVKRDIVFFREEFGTGEKNSINFIETVYYIPAQRVLTIENGWPKSFDSYNVFDPYVLKKFSENLRKFVEFDLQFQKELFISKSIKPFVFLLDRNLFYKGKLKISKKFLKKRLVIEINNREIPFMVWSSGQREFIPMLCMQCNNPPCVRACPVEATYKDKRTGIVRMHYEKCIGCNYCVELAYNRWRMSKKDGKATLIGGINKKGFYTVRIGDEELEE